MTHRMQSHPRGSLPRCPHCQREAAHILDTRTRPIGGHLLSCSCGETPKFEDLDAAKSAFCNARGIRITRSQLAPVRSAEPRLAVHP